ncbi:MAG: hypothetical protein P9X27_03595 [Candidatus Kaelpia aquatica]|nr:hypothetical protein [Candidatus Kaelpia aquatica]
MKRKSLILMVLVLFLTISTVLYGSDFDNVLKGVFSAVSEPTKTYTFSAGEKILSNMGEDLYYSGYEYSGNRKTLLLTCLEGGNAILMKFPEPDLITVRGMRFKIIEFNNQQLKIEKVYR